MEVRGDLTPPRHVKQSQRDEEGLHLQMEMTVTQEKNKKVLKGSRSGNYTTPQED